MSIEVKQLVVRGEIHSGAEANAPAAGPAIDLETLREEILEDCRHMLEDLIEQQRER